MDLGKIPTVYFQVIGFVLVGVFIVLAVYFRWDENREKASKRKKAKKNK